MNNELNTRQFDYSSSDILLYIIFLTVHSYIIQLLKIEYILMNE